MIALLLVTNVPYCCASTKTGTPVGSAACTTATATRRGGSSNTQTASIQVIAGCKISLTRTSQPTSKRMPSKVHWAVNKPAAKSAQGTKAPPSTSQKE